MSKRFISIAFLLTFVLSLTIAQLRLNNLAEYQIGNIPGVDPTNQSSLYNQLNLTYKYKSISLFSRIEQYYPTFDYEIKTYTKLSQYKAQYSSEKFTFEAGNLYTTLGRGLLLRNYEIPSSIYEDRGYRIRYGFYKDLLGVSAKYNTKHLGIKLLRGTVLAVELPPTTDLSDRRADLIEAGEFDFRLKEHTLGFILMRHSLGSSPKLYNSLYYNGQIKNFNLYAELAQRTDSIENIFNFNDSESYGAYLALSYSGLQGGLTIEIKDYQNFIIGKGINDPPTLVKEHSSKLLNRATHVPLISDEKGYQTEFWYLFQNLSMLTLNHSFAQNNSASNTFNYIEFYAEYKFNLLTDHQLRLLADYTQDPLKRQPNRYTGGILFDLFTNTYTSVFDVEIQYINSESGSVNSNFLNNLFSYTLSKSGSYSINAQVETTKDPNIIEEDKNINIYPSISISYKIDKHNKILLFAGKRRGGPACTSGVCYDVLDFQGVELRLTTRL